MDIFIIMCANIMMTVTFELPCYSIRRVDIFASADNMCVACRRFCANCLKKIESVINNMIALPIRTNAIKLLDVVLIIGVC